MRHLKTRKGLLSTIILTMFLAVAIPATALGQGRGHGRGHGRNSTWSSLSNRKCGKFVNCHDARNGRWDNRGPRGDRVSNILRNRRLRNRNYDSNRWLQRRARWRNR
jgi:hypothetical protein